MGDIVTVCVKMKRGGIPEKLFALGEAEKRKPLYLSRSTDIADHKT